MIRALLLDVGNTLCFLDCGAVADVAARAGHPVPADALARVEGQAKRRYEALMASGTSHEDGWGLYLSTLLEAGGLPSDVARALVPALRSEHDAFNLWRRVPEGVPGALEKARAAGLRLGVVSNSEGKLPELFARVGLDGAFETIVDSHLEGVRKPDPELFRIALRRMQLDPSEALYAGDIPGVDCVGAEAAGLRAVLVDPLGFYPHHEGERVASVAELVDRVLAQR